MLSIRFHQTLQPLLLGGGEGKSHCEVLCAPPSSYPSPSLTLPAPCLTSVAKRATAGPPAVCCPQEVVLLGVTPTIYKGLPERGAGIEEVPDVHTLAGTSVRRLQAEVRPQDCKDGRGPGSVMQILIIA